MSEPNHQTARDRALEEKARAALQGHTSMADLEARLMDLLRSVADEARREEAEKLKPWLSHTGINCGGYYGDKPDECECGLLEAKRG